MTMADCRFCRTRITSCRNYWVHLDPNAGDHERDPEPPLDHKWHEEGNKLGRVEKDAYGPKWPKPWAKVKLDPDLYERDEDYEPPKRSRRKRPPWRR